MEDLEWEYALGKSFWETNGLKTNKCTFFCKDRVAIRHLKINRIEEFLNDITKFVENNIGKEYKFSMKNYILARNSTA